MKTIFALLIVTTAVSAAVAPVVQDRKPTKAAAADKKPAKPEDPKVTEFMREKLTASQGVLEGLVTEDFGKIEKGAQKMLVMSKAASWQVFHTPTYAQYSAEFQRTTERLAKMAKKKQLDSAALQYMHVTMTCINCHKYVHKERVAQGMPLSPGLKFALQQDRLRNSSSRN